MRISLGTLLLTVTLIALVCIVAIQNSRSAKRIVLLETELQAKEIELAQFVLRQTGHALYGDEKLSDVEQREQQQYQIAETILKLWYHGDLIMEHGAKLGRSGMIYDEDPAVRARLGGLFQRRYCYHGIKHVHTYRIKAIAIFYPLDSVRLQLI